MGARIFPAMAFLTASASWLTAPEVAPSAPGVARCSLEPPWMVSPGEAIVLARPTGESRELPAPEPLQADSIPTMKAFTFEVIEVAGARDVLEGAELTITPFHVAGPSCPFRPAGLERWVPDTEVVFVLGPPMDVEGEPVHLTLVEQNPYPYGRNFRLGTWRAEDPPTEWLSATEYFAMLSALPRLGSDRPSAELATATLSTFASGDPRWSDAFPGKRILQMVGGGGQRPFFRPQTTNRLPRSTTTMAVTISGSRMSAFCPQV